MSEGAAEDRGWGGGGGGGVWGEEAACVWAKKQRLPVTSEQVCVFRDLGKEGHTHTDRHAYKLRWRSSRGSCGFQSAKDAGQLERADWPGRTGRACPGRGSLPQRDP